MNQPDYETVASVPSWDSAALGGKTVLLVGGNGFIGSHLIAELNRLNRSVLDQPCRTLVVDNLVTSRALDWHNSPSGELRYIQQDVILPWLVDEPVDYVVHLAGIASPHHYANRPLETIDVATLGLRNSLNIASEHNARLLFFSSSEIYGNPGKENIPTRETFNGLVSCTGDRACYDESKRLGETLTSTYVSHLGTDCVTVRPFNVFGPGMLQNDYRIIPSFVQSLLSRNQISVFGDGNQTRTYCYVSDAIRGFLQVLLFGRKGEAYNIGNPSPEISALDLAVALVDLFPDYNPRVAVVPYPDAYPSDEPRRRCPDISKARDHLGYEPVVPLWSGLNAFVEWAKASYE